MKYKIVTLSILAFILVLSIASAVTSVLEPTNFGFAGNNDGNQARATGNQFFVGGTTIVINNYTVTTVNTCDTAYILNASQAVLDTSTNRVGNTFIFNNKTAVANKFYYAITNKSGGCVYNWLNGVTYNVSGTFINWTAAWNSVDNQNTTNNAFNSVSLGVSTPTPPIVPSINVTLSLPANATIIVGTSANLTANYSVVTYNMTNATYTIWYANSTVLNTTVMQVKGNNTNGTTLSLYNLSLGQYTWNVQLCVTNSTGQAVNCSVSAVSNFTFQIGANGTFGYRGNTYETLTEYFSVNISIVPGTSIDSALLFYNGTIYNQTTVNLLQPNLYMVSRNFTIGLNTNAFANETHNLFWIINYVGGFSENLTRLTQNVSYINLQLCNATYNIPTLNFTIKNESNFVELNGSLSAFFSYWVGNGDVVKNYTYNQTNLLGASRYNFCMYPNTANLSMNFTTDASMSYTSQDFVIRYYYLSSAILTNATSLTDLLLLPSSLGQQFLIDVKQGVDSIDNAIVYIARQYISLGNGYKTVGVRTTNSNGRFVEYLELNNNYQATIVKNGEVLGIVNFNSICGATPCELTLQLPSSAGNLFSPYYDIFGQAVQGNLTFNETNNIVRFVYVDTTGLAKYVRLLVTQGYYNNTAATICDNYLYSVAGTITCNVTGFEGDFVATAYISRSPEKILDYITFTITHLKENLGTTGLFVSLLLGAIVVCGFFYYDLALGILSIPAVMSGLKMIHILPLAWTPIIGLWVICIWGASRIRG